MRAQTSQSKHAACEQNKLDFSSASKVIEARLALPRPLASTLEGSPYWFPFDFIKKKSHLRMNLFQKNFKGYIFAVLLYLIDCQNAEKETKAHWLFQKSMLQNSRITAGSYNLVSITTVWTQNRVFRAGRLRAGRLLGRLGSTVFWRARLFGVVHVLASWAACRSSRTSSKSFNAHAMH